MSAELKRRLRVDWHDSECRLYEGVDIDGEPFSWPCDCGLPEHIAFREAEAVAEAIKAERKRIALELSTHISRSTMPVFAHFDSWGVGQVVQGKPWPEGW